MDDFDEDLIWDTIMESGKSKIDYAAFGALFPIKPDNFLSSMIYGFAVGLPPEVITDKIVSQITATGNTVDEDALFGFVLDSQPALALQIALNVKVIQMLNAGEEPELVYEMVVNSLAG